MKYKIAILGSTGSIGKSLLKITLKNKEKFKVSLLTSNKNYKLLLKQAIMFKVKNVIITDKKTFNFSKNIFKKNNIKSYNNFKNLQKIFPKKIDYAMSSIVGLDGLVPTFNIIKFTKKISIANKETIICEWNIIKKELKKHNTDFVPVDSEHFSIWYALQNNKSTNIEKLYLTASGGPLLNISFSNFDKLKIEKIIKHPNWRMGTKISVDSSTMVNKIFEIIEAKKIFNISYRQLEILIHPKSYVHAIIKFKDGMIKIIAHETTMEIPISNTLYSPNLGNFVSKEINLKKLNQLKLSKISKKKFPLTKIINLMPENDSLFETILVTINDELVKLFLSKKFLIPILLKNYLNLYQVKNFININL